MGRGLGFKGVELAGLEFRVQGLACNSLTLRREWGKNL